MTLICPSEDETRGVSIFPTDLEDWGRNPNSYFKDICLLSLTCKAAS